MYRIYRVGLLTPMPTNTMKMADRMVNRIDFCMTCIVAAAARFVHSNDQGGGTGQIRPMNFQ
jgi:hypothetical protein